MEEKNVVLICQGRSCKSFGSVAILEAFKNYSCTNFEIVGSGCLGQCGNGPMVLFLPQENWYDRVSQKNIPVLVRNQLLNGQAVSSLLYRVKHPYK